MFKILDKVCTPRRGTKYSAYVDLFAREDLVIPAGENMVIPLGVKIDFEGLRTSIAEEYLNPYYNYSNKEINSEFYEFLKSHYLEVAIKNSLVVKGLIIPNGIGVIDLDYEGEVGLIVHNPQKILLSKSKDERDMWIKHERSDFKIKKGDRVAQCTLKEHKGFLMGYESDAVRDGGYGSTGK